MAQDLNGSNVTPAKNIVKVNVLRANVKQTKVIDTDIVFVLEDGRTVFIRDGAVQSLLDNGFSVEFSDGDQATGQELLQSAGAAELSSVALTGPQASTNDSVIVAQAPQAVGTSPVAQPSSGGGLRTWLAVGTPLVGGVLGGVLGGGGGGSAAATTTTTTAGTGTGTTASVKPATPVINVVSSDDKVSAAEKAAGVSVSGIAEPSASVTVNWGSTSKTVTADSAGRWTASFASGEVPADATGTTVSATVKSTAGVSSDPATKIVQIDATAPASPVIAKIAGDDIIGPTEKTASVNVNGTAEAGSTVSVEFGGVNRSVAADPGGNWGVSFAPTEVPVAGSYSVTATTRDAIGNVAAAPASRLIVVAAAVTVSGQIVAGPVVVGNGLAVDIFRGDGTLLVSGIRVNADGSFTANNLPIGAGDVVFVRVVDNTTGADYLDETTGVATDLNAVLLAVKAVEGTSVTMNINPLTTIAAIKAGLAADGGGTVTNAAAATNANTATAQAFGLSGIDITTASVVATNSGGYTSADGLSSGEKVGAVLAALSGLDSLNAGNSQTTITALSQLVTVDGNKGQLSSDGQLSLMRGATAAEDKVEGSLQNLISDSVAASSPVTQVTLNAIATDNIITANEVTNLTLSGTVGPDVTGVSVLLGNRTAAAIVSGGTWSYTLSAADTDALGADGAKVIQAQAAVRNAPSVTASRLVTLKIAPPATPSLNVVSGDNAINSAEKTAGIAFGGTGEAGSSVFLTFGSFTKSVLVDASGTWTTAFLASEIPADGSATVSVLAKDAFGNSSGTVTRSIQIDIVVPSLPTIRSVTGDDLIGPTEKVGGVQIQGTADPLGSIRLTFGNLVRTATVDALGNWSVNLISSQVPEDGEYALSVVQSDAVGNPSAVATRTVKVDAQPPGKPVIQPVATDNIINAAEKLNGVTLRGTSEPNASIELTWGSISRIIKVAANGTWSASFNGAQIPADGTANIVVVATDTSGNVSEPGIRPVTIDTLSQDLTIASVATDNVINAAEKAVNVTVTGQAEPGANVVVTLGGITRNALANQSGVWVVNFPTAEIPADTDVTTVTAQSTDQAGNVSGLVGRDIRIDTVIPDAPVINIVSDDNSINAGESTASVEVSGTAETGALVTVSWGTATRTSTADAEGVWRTTFAASQIPPEGASIVSATARDSALNVSAATERPVLIDIGTATPVINSIAGNDVINGNERTNGVLVSGTAEAGATVRLVWGTVIKNPVALADGTWSQLFGAAEIPLSGNSVITATPTDQFGNVGLARQRSFSIDTSVSPATFDNVTGPENRVNASEKSLGVQVTGTAEAGSTVLVKWGATEKSVTTDASGVWATSFTSAQIPSDGETTITAVVTDSAGNVSVQSGQPVTIDTAAPGAPIVTLPIAGDNVINSSERAAGVVVAGTSEANADVTIAWGTTSSQTVKADALGNWQATFVGDQINAVGAATISVTQRDVAGNTGTAATAPVVVNTGAPLAPFVAAVATNDVVNAAEKGAGVTISGSALSGSTISVTWGSTPTKTVTADSDERWSIDFDAGDVPTDGSPNLSVFQTDTLGNVSPTASRPITVDTVLPGVPAINTPIAGNNIINLNEKSGTVTILGTAPSGTKVEVRIGGGTEKPATFTDSSNWSFTFGSGDIPADATGVLIEARTVDTAGNPSVWVAAPPVTIDTLAPLAPSAITFGGSDNVVSLAEADGNQSTQLVVAGSLASNHGAAKVFVTLAFGGNTYSQDTSVTAGATTWSLNWTKANLPTADGDYVANTYTVDAAGNESTPVPVNFKVDRGIVATPSITSIGAGTDFVINIDENDANTLAVRGTGDTRGGTVFLTFGTSPTVVGSATVGADGNWTIDLLKANYPTSDVEFKVYQVLPNSNRSAAVSQLVTRDLLQPVAPSITVPSEADRLINNVERPAGLTLSGSATGAAKVLLTWTTDSTAYSEEVDVFSSSWSSTIASTKLPTGVTPTDLTISARAIDAAGNRSAGTAQQTYTFDTIAPLAPSAITFGGSDNVVSVAEADVANQSTQLVVAGSLASNHGAAKVVVTLAFGGNTYSQETSVTAGATPWSLNWAKANLPTADGDYVANIYTVDAAGNESTRVPVNFTVDRGIVATPSITSIGAGTDFVINIDENDADTLAVRGTGDTRGGTVFLTLGASQTVVGSATVGADGNWTIDLLKANYPTSDGNFNVYQVLPNSNRSITVSQLVTRDLLQPVAPSITVPSEADRLINNVERPAGLTLSGSATGAAKVLLTWTTDSTAYSQEVDVFSGSWSSNIASTRLPTGVTPTDLVISARAIDAAGNSSSGTAQQTYTFDTIAPLAPSAITFGGSDNVVSVAEADVANQSTQLVVAGSLASNHGAAKVVVTLAFGGNTYSQETPVTAGATPWSLNWTKANLPTADGDYVANIYTVDAAGNESTREPVNFKVDRGIVATPIITSIGAGTDFVINIDENEANTLAVRGTGDTRGGTVFLTLGTSQTVVGSATVGADGNWTIDLLKANYPTSDVEFKVYQVLPNSNRSAAVSQLVTRDLVAPVAPSITVPSEADRLISNSERSAGLTLSGSANGAAKVLLTWTTDSTAYSQEVDVFGGSWSSNIASTRLPTGVTPTDLVISARAIDAAGNSSSGTVQQTYTFDTIAPLAPSAITFGGSNNVVSFDEANVANLSTPLVVAGSLTPNHGAAKVVVTLAFGGNTYSQETPVTAGAITWSLNWNKANLPTDDNAYVAKIYTEDAAGNRTQVDHDFNISRAPAAMLTNVVVAGDGKINLLESQAASITITGGNAAVGSTVFVTLGNGSGQTDTIAGDGTWTVNIPTSSLALGTQPSLTLSAFQRNSAGNDSPPVQQTNITVDLAPPGNLVLNAVTLDNRINAEEAGGTITVSGSVEVGITLVAVSFGGVTQNASVSSGIWSTDFAAGPLRPLEDGTQVLVSVTATDGVGNTTTTDRSIPIDTSPPIGLTVGVVADNDIVNAGEAGQGITISGKAVPGISVSVDWDGRTRSTTANAVTGDWSVFYVPDRASSVGVPTDGPAVVLSVTQSDSFGNAQTVSRAIQIDTIAPSAPLTTDLLGISNDYQTARDLSTSQNGNILVGRGVAGQFVEISINGSPTYNRIAVNSRGIWTYAAPELSGNGVASTVTLTGRVVDEAGNSSALTSFTSVRRQVQTPTPIETGTASGSVPGLMQLAANNVAVQTNDRISGVYLRGATNVGGDGNGDRFGGSFAVGDVNNDNRPDLIVGAWNMPNVNLANTSPGTTAVGEVNVIFGRSDWTSTSLIETQKMGTGGYGLRGERANDNLGGNVAFLGDLNGDGRGDFAGVALNNDFNGGVNDNFGAVYVMFSPTSTLGELVTNAAAGNNGASKYVSSVGSMDKSSGFIFRGTGAGDRAGNGIVGAKLNGNDTIADIAIGIRDYDRVAHAPSGLSAATNVGAVAIIFGRSDGNYTNVASTAKQELNINSLVAPGSLIGSAAGAEGFLIRGNSGNATSDSQFGSAIGKGDFNKDGIEDLIIGAPFYEANGFNNTGAAYVIYGKADKAAWNTILADDPSRPNVGGTTNFGKVLDVGNLTEAHGFRITGELQNGGQLGLSVQSAGDVNGDGIDDMIIGTANWDGSATDSGVAYVVFGKTGTTRGNIDLTTLTAADGFIIRGALASDAAGSSAAGVGDVNGDGYGDIVVTVPGFDKSGTSTNWGQAYLILGKADGSIYGSLSGTRSILNLNEFGPGDGIVLNGPVVGSQLGGVAPSGVFGTSVGVAGDLNQDGFADFILGAPSRNPVDSFIIFGSAGLGGMTQTGTTGADNLLGGTFNDTISGGGGVDNILSFQGNDIITVPDLLFNFIDGGTGTDTLRLAGGSAINLDLSTLAAGAIKDIEQIDLVAGSAANTLTVTEESLRGLSSTSDLLKVFGDSGDTVTATGFLTGETVVEKGITYTIYTKGLATLWVQEDVQVEGVVPLGGFAVPPISWADQAVLAG